MRVLAVHGDVMDGEIDGVEIQLLQSVMECGQSVRDLADHFALFDVKSQFDASIFEAIIERGGRGLVRARHAEDGGPLDTQCACPACARFSRAYLHHVVKANEIIASMLITWHNLAYYQDLMQGARDAIATARLAEFCAAAKEGWARGDLPTV